MSAEPPALPLWLRRHEKRPDLCGAFLMARRLARFIRTGA